MAWGGPEEQARERERGKLNAKDWHDEALKVVEKAMEEYWQEPTVTARPNAPETSAGKRKPAQVTRTKAVESEFDRHRRTLIQQSAKSNNVGGWAAELRRYLSDLPADVTKHTNILSWWQVRGSGFRSFVLNLQCSN
jgi:hypothetical protein